MISLSDSTDEKEEEMFLKRSFILLAVIFMFVCSLGSMSCRSEAGNPTVESAAGRSDSKAPDFTLKDLEGKDVRLSDFSGKVVILDFWATWCPPCRMEVPHFQALYEEYSAKGLVVLGVALDDGGVSDVKPFVKANGVTYPVVIGNERVVASYGGIRGIPTTFIIDRNGNVTEKAVGYRDRSFFESAIKKLL